MLQAIRDKAHGIFAWVMLILVGIPFGLWGINNYFGGGKEKPVAVVGDKEIFERDVNRHYENLVSRMGSSDFDEKQLRHESLEQLIDNQLVAQGARDRNLTVGDADIRAYVQSQPFFESDGKFDREKLKSILSAQGVSPAQYTAQIAEQLINDQFVKGVSTTGFVTNRQMETFYMLRNQERTVEYFTIPVKTVESAIPDGEIEAYYQSNKAQFQNPEKLSVEYVTLSLDDIGVDFKPTEEELKNLYEEQKSQFGSPERRRVSHILLNADPDREDSIKAAETKAEELRQRLAKGENFAVLAREFSDDKESGAKGGDLGFIDKGAVDPNFANAAFALRQDEVSQPVRTPFGIHLIKLVELVPSTIRKFEDVRDELTKNYQRSAAENSFYDAKQKLDELSFEHNDSLDFVAGKLNLKVSQTAPFTREAGEGVAGEESFRNAAFSQEVLEGKNSAVLEIGNDKVYVLHLKEHEPSSDKPLVEVRPQIIAKLRNKLAQDAVRKQAEQLLSEVRQGKPLAEAAKSAGATVKKSVVKLVGKTDLPTALIAAVNKAPPPRDGKTTTGLASLENGEQVLFNLTEVRDGSMASVDPKELEMAKEYLSRNAGQAEFGAFLAQLRELAKVKVNAAE